jgi:Lon-like ATP-dependent protease
VNFPGGAPIDGPSAGIAMATAIYSAITERPVDNYVAMTGELSIHGTVKPIGGVVAKVEAARFAGVKKVLVPKENWQDIFEQMEGIQVIAVERLEEVLQHAIIPQAETESQPLGVALRPATELLNPSPTSI